MCRGLDMDPNSGSREPKGLFARHFFLRKLNWFPREEKEPWSFPSITILSLPPNKSSFLAGLLIDLLAGLS